MRSSFSTALLAFLASVQTVMAQTNTFFPGVIATGTIGPTNPPTPTMRTLINQTSYARLLTVNSINDFCIFAPPHLSNISDSETFEVAWCTQQRNNARLIPDKTLTAVSFLNTDAYVQVYGYGDSTKLNIPEGDSGGEFDPHGAFGSGNPIGGNVTSNITGSDENYAEWMLYIDYNQFCLRVCTSANSTYSAAQMCWHELDEIGCGFIMPANNRTFETCDADVAYPPDWEVLGTKAISVEWALLDYTFTSAVTRECKPNIGSFEHIIERTGIGPSRTISVDGKLENVLIAGSFGMHGIVFDDQLKVIKDLKNFDYDPVLHGKRFLASRKKKLNSVTSNGIELLENFAQLLILEATGDQSLVTYVKHPGQFNFFQNGGVLTTKDFPNDLDTTSLGLTISDHIDAGTKHEVMDEMLDYQNSHGIIQVYFDHSRPRTDLVVCVNVLNLFYKNGRGHELSETLNWVERALVNRTYILGTYYYVSADHFLFFFSRLLQNSVEVRRRLGPVFKERIKERFGAKGDSLSLAARILAATVMNLVDDCDLRTLLSMQREDGSWGNSWFYQYGSSGIRIKNDGVTTALAVQAIEKVQLLRNMHSNA